MLNYLANNIEVTDNRVVSTAIHTGQKLCSMV